MDFTLSTYRTLIETLQKQGFSFLSYNEFISKSADKAIILRHDVDLLPGNSLKFARIQSEMGINGTYYFRVVPQSFNEKIIKEIHSMGHEVGYHYEDVSLAAGRLRDSGTKGLQVEAKRRSRLGGDRKSKRSGDPAPAGIARQ